MTDLTRLLVEAGLVQFGSFSVGGVEVPVQMGLDMLPSYPAVLRKACTTLVPLVPVVDHLICSADAVPLGVALSLETGIPLVYSRGTGDEPVHDLVGAYDIGHPAALLTTVWSDDASLQRLAANARRVGLDVQTGLALIDLGRATATNLPVRAVLRLQDVVDVLVSDALLPPGQADAVRRWLVARD